MTAYSDTMMASKTVAESLLLSMEDHDGINLGVEGGFNNEQANWFGTKKRGLCGYKNLHIETGGPASIIILFLIY